MNTLKKLAVLFLFISTSFESFAQCPMCKAAAESSIESGSTVAIGLNSGILYLLLMPYILIGIIAAVWYYNHKKKVVNS